MKKFLVAFSMMLAVLFTTNSAQAQVVNAPDVIAAAGNLVNVQVGDVTVNAVDVMDVSNVLNNADIRVLNNILNDLTIDNVLNDLLRDAEIIKNNQVVVGVVVNALSGAVEQIFVMQQRRR